jgi:hypothetical protein
MSESALSMRFSEHVDHREDDDPHRRRKASQSEVSLADAVSYPISSD